MNKGLSFLNIDHNYDLAIDPDNVFWVTAPADKDNKAFLSRKALSLYQKTQNKLDKEMQQFRFSSKLTAIYIDPTDKCNADCSYCYVPKKIRKSGKEMTGAELEYVLKKIARYFSRSKKKPVIVFHASEPLLVKDIVFKAIAQFKNQFHFGLQTNALLLKKEDVNFLKKHRVGVGISLDSDNRQINDKLRPNSTAGGNFNKAIKAIEWFAGYPGLNVITTITRLNVTQLPNLVKLLHKKQVACVLLNPVRLTQKQSRSVRPDENTLTKYFIRAVDTALELSKTSKKAIIIGNFANVILGIIAPSARRLMCDISPCGGGRCFLTITASGEMIPCGEFIGIKGFSGGNIFNSSISHAMQSEPFKQIRSRFVEKIDECGRCALRNICGAPCPAELHALGNMYKKSVFCEFYKKITAHAFKLIAEGQEKYLLRGDALGDLRYEYKL